ncbi:hypothetical protein BJ165DRAFT_1527394 [Panaeolus papilionaceus]|nr:hypothetical protein BJ165DRAFT_1527394 [Panaeolus papilionaceus]
MSRAAGEIISPISLKGPAEVAHGWMFIGFFVNVLLLGIMITQVYIYFTQYKSDKAWIKIFVAALFAADVVQTIFIFVYLHRTLITSFGDIENLSKADWLFATDPALTGIIASAVQLFFAWRVYVLTKTWIYTFIIFALAMAGGVASIVTAVEVGRTPTFTEFQRFQATVIVWLAAEAVADRKHKSGFKRSDMMVDRIIRITVQTGLLTMIVASLDLLFFLIDPTGTHLLFNFPLCKLYSNSLMSSLNSRRGWKYGGSNTGAESDGILSTPGNMKRTGPSTSVKPNDIINLDPMASPEVFVHVESHELRDVPNGEKRPYNNSQSNTSSVDRSDEKWHGGQAWAGP